MRECKGKIYRRHRCQIRLLAALCQIEGPIVYYALMSLVEYLLILIKESQLYIVGDPKNIQHNERKRFQGRYTFALPWKSIQLWKEVQGRRQKVLSFHQFYVRRQIRNGILTKYNKYLFWISISLSGGSYWII
jgi:hypothetical protein